MQKRRKLGRGVAIVGAGMSQFGMFKGKDSKDLFIDAFKEMVASVDKGVDLTEIDALYLGNFTNDFFVHQSHWGPIISDLIGLAPRPATRTEGACASSALAFREGVFAIASGQIVPPRKLPKVWPWQPFPMTREWALPSQLCSVHWRQRISRNMAPPVNIS